MYFFKTFAGWDDSKPIFVHRGNPSDYEVYDEALKSEFPVFTPLRPHQLTTFGTTKSSKSKIISEFKRAHDICMTVVHKKEIQEAIKSANINSMKKAKQGNVNYYS